MNTEATIEFLKQRGWIVSSEKSEYSVLKAPPEFQFKKEFTIRIPLNKSYPDYKIYTEKVISIISQLYNLTEDDLIAILEDKSSIFKIKINDESVTEGKIAFTKFEEIIEKTKNILSDTASFVIHKSYTQTKASKEVKRYLRLCNFMQTEKGSYVINIQLPNNVIVKQQELAHKEIYSDDINHKLFEVLNFVSNDIFSGKVSESDSYVDRNIDKINIHLYKNISRFFDKTNIKNVDFTFHDIEKSNHIHYKEINNFKVDILESFTKFIEKQNIVVDNFTFRGRINDLHSEDPDGTTNSVSFGSVYNHYEVEVKVNLESLSYKQAVDAHKSKNSIEVSGLAKISNNTTVRFIEVTYFKVIN
jgi:hypothetical protein